MMSRKLTFVAFLGLALALGPAEAPHAQPPPVQAKAVQFAIPAGSLVDAISAFQDQAGVPPTGFPAAGIGKQSGGVSGLLTPPEALERLLSGTGLTFLQRDDGGFMIEPLANVRIPGGRCAMDKRKDKCVEK